MTGVGFAAMAAVLAAGGVAGAVYDFGYLDFYHPMKEAQPGQTKVACVGDSITFGCTVRRWRRNNYPAVLGRLLGDQYCVNNFGYTNRTAIKTADYPYTKTKLYEKSLAWESDIVFLLLGSNDSKENNWDREKFLRDYQALAKSYLALPYKPQVYLMTPPPLFEVGGRVMWKLRKDIVAQEICPAVRRLSREMNLPCIDLYRVFSGKKELFSDGVHPNRKGSLLLAQTVERAIRGEEKQYWFYGWEEADSKPVSADYPGIGSPWDLYDRLKEIWCCETCAPRLRDRWTAENKTLGQCSITAFLTQDIFGGKVYGILRPGGNYHCYNVIGSRCFDLTSEQFGEEKLDYGENPEQFREVHFAKEEKRLRYELLKEKLKQACK